METIRIDRLRAYLLNGCALNGYVLNGYVLVGYVLNGYVLVGYVLVGYVLNGYVWCEIRQQSSEEPCDETSFGNNVVCMWVWVMPCASGGKAHEGLAMCLVEPLLFPGKGVGGCCFSA